MADPLQKKSAEVPNFDTYPSTPSTTDGDSLVSPQARQERAVPAEIAEKLHTRPERVAGAIGKAIGKLTLVPSRTRTAVGSVGDRVSDFKNAAQQRLEDLAWDTRQTLGGAAGSARLRISDFADATNAKVNELTSQTRWKLEQVAHRSKRYVRENPLQVLLAITAIAFAVGLGIRLASRRPRND